MKTIRIYRNGNWSGTGKLTDEGIILDCTADLSTEHTPSDDVYSDIEDNIFFEREGMDVDGHHFTWEIE